jgi:hypothetical protein
VCYQKINPKQESCIHLSTVVKTEHIVHKACLGKKDVCKKCFYEEQQVKVLPENGTPPSTPDTPKGKGKASSISLRAVLEYMLDDELPERPLPLDLQAHTYTKISQFIKKYGVVFMCATIGVGLYVLGDRVKEIVRG